RIDAGHTTKGLGDDRGGEVVGTCPAQRASSFADRGANGGNDYGVFHKKMHGRTKVLRYTSCCLTLAGPILKQILDRVRHLADLAVEEMIGAVDDHQLFRLGGARIKLADVFQRAELVAFPVNEKLRLRAGA